METALMIYDDEMTKVAITANYVKRMLSILDGISLEEISGEEDDCEDSITVYKEYLEKIENQEYDICDLELQKQEMEAIYNSWEVIDEDVKEQIDDFFCSVFLLTRNNRGTGKCRSRAERRILCVRGWRKAGNSN